MSLITVLNPQVFEEQVPVSLAPELASLAGKRVAFVDNSKCNADLFLSHVVPMLTRLGAQAGTTVRKLAPKDELATADVELLTQHDAVIQCFGD